MGLLATFFKVLRCGPGCWLQCVVFVGFPKLNLSETLSLLLPEGAQHSGINLGRGCIGMILFGVISSVLPQPVIMGRKIGY
jgi:hypothetical protein